MFAIEIEFSDGVSAPEMILVRRPQALIGPSEYAHVVIDDMRDLDYELRIVRDLGERFRCKPVGKGKGQGADILGGVYAGETTIDTGPVKLHITSLDFDLFVRDGEVPDRAGVRVLRQVCSYGSPGFPAIVVMGADPMIVSFVPDQVVYIGRSNQCAVRLDSSDVSSRHARMGYESGEFWIEDLGSTNGTFVDGQQISGRVSVKPGVPIVLGREMSVFGVTNEDQIVQVSSMLSGNLKRPKIDATFPVLMSVSEVARPARVLLAPGSEIFIGRDPSCDMWLGAPHVSRRHCVVRMSKTGQVSVEDLSTNGTAYAGGVLRRGDMLDISGQPNVLNFGGSITVGICFDEQQEEIFVNSDGAPHIFLTAEQAEQLAGPNEMRTQVIDDFTLAGITSGKKSWVSMFRYWSFRRKLMFVFTVLFVLFIVAFLFKLLMPIFL